MTGIINLLPMNFISVSNVDGNTSNQIRVTVVPNSYDIIPVRNQVLQLDLVNTTINATVDAITSTGIGYTTTTTDGVSTTTVSTAASTASSSAY